MLGSNSFIKKFTNFPNSEGDFKIRIVEFIEENNVETSMDCDRFTDSEFPPNDARIGQLIFADFKELKVQWIRASKLADVGVALFDKIEPNDVAQGKIGNCWLMAAISALAEFPEFIMNNVFPKNDSLKADCCYYISL